MQFFHGPGGRLTEGAFHGSMTINSDVKRGRPMLKRFKNLKPQILLIHVLISLAYPAAKALTSEGNQLLIFCDVLTIIAGILLIAGVFYSLVLHGDFDNAGFAVRRGVRSFQQTYETYRKNQQQKREEAFNYPLFLGLVYIALSAFIA